MVAADLGPSATEALNAIVLNCQDSSKITSVSLYASGAEITRVLKCDAKTGQNKLTVNGLPNVLDEDSIRIEGRGTITIHDVAISQIRSISRSMSPTLIALLTNEERIDKALERCKKSLTSLESYLTSAQVQHINISELRNVLKEYNDTAEELDNRVLELERELSDTQKKIGEERVKQAANNRSEKLNMRATVGIFVESSGEVELVFTYAVHNARWKPGYDIRATTKIKETPITLTYKAAITQSTGEDWKDVPLTLETATPTFGDGVPTLPPWKLSVYKTDGTYVESLTKSQTAGPQIYSKGEALLSKGSANATFHVPGIITIPADGVAHNVTIAKLNLDATMSWVCVPKRDTKTYLNANVKNASQYTLLRGTGSIYLDGTFISRTQVPSVSPDETFDCSLGLDPAIRVTYHPRTKKQTKNGFYIKSTTQLFTQPITVFNNKETAVQGVKIIEQVPVSEDVSIQVKLINPPLHSPKVLARLFETCSNPLVIEKGVVAYWEEDNTRGAEDGGQLAWNGKFCWVCTIPAQGKVDFLFQWEVAAPAHTEIVGLV
ncbi:Protein F37C4.5 [Hypsizygus marmoreus]|uniref:Protein F37C4.5 n=1 Tax=Hypsizygus marmoreus TaxID=39966 RepID=A0A369J1I0_HYPMA|nr:Protein F37C4.5 [Hypsizygus marmoreus]